MLRRRKPEDHRAQKPALHERWSGKEDDLLDLIEKDGDLNSELEALQTNSKLAACFTEPDHTLIDHVVKDDDDLTALAVRYDLSEGEIRRFNRKVVFDHLLNVVGDTLKIPVTRSTLLRLGLRTNSSTESATSLSTPHTLITPAAKASSTSSVAAPADVKSQSASTGPPTLVVPSTTTTTTTTPTTTATVTATEAERAAGRKDHDNKVEVDEMAEDEDEEDDIDLSEAEINRRFQLRRAFLMTTTRSRPPCDDREADFYLKYNKWQLRTALSHRAADLAWEEKAKAEAQVKLKEKTAEATASSGGVSSSGRYRATADQGIELLAIPSPSPSSGANTSYA